MQRCTLFYLAAHRGLTVVYRVSSLVARKGRSPEKFKRASIFVWKALVNEISHQLPAVCPCWLISNTRHPCHWWKSPLQGHPAGSLIFVNVERGNVGIIKMYSWIKYDVSAFVQSMKGVFHWLSRQLHCQYQCKGKVMHFTLLTQWAAKCLRLEKELWPCFSCTEPLS